MIQYKLHARIGGLVLAAVILSAALLVASNGFANNGAFTDPEIPEGALADKAAANFLCTSVADVAAFGGAAPRIHVRCGNINGAVVYYAYASDPANSITADQMLAIANTALALGKTLRVYYDTNTGMNPPGCSPVDCRGLTGVQLFQ